MLVLLRVMTKREQAPETVMTQFFDIYMWQQAAMSQ